MNRKTLRGVTLTELLVVIGVCSSLAVFASINWKNSIASARKAECLGNLRVLGSASMTYAADNDMTLPATSHQRRLGKQSWTRSLPTYTGGTACFRCPCDSDPDRPYSYLINDFLTRNPAGAADLDYSRMTRLDQPSTVILFAEAADGMAGSDHFHFAAYRGMKIPAEVLQNQVAVRRHEESANYLFADGHAENITWERVQAMLAEVPSNFVDPTAAAPTPTPYP